MAVTAVFMLTFTLSCSDDDDKVGNGGDGNGGGGNGSGNDEVCQCEVDDNATVLQVGTDKEYKTIAAVAAVAGDNTVIEVDAGTYSGDAALAFWKKNNLVIRAVGGEVILDAAGKYYDGMGIWKIQTSGKICVEGITFQNAKVPDRNGAGIRLVDGALTVINSRFLNNEMGLLTGNLATTSLVIRNSEFGYSHNNGTDNRSHNLYVGQIGSLDVSGSYFHHINNGVNSGHLFKSRAAINKIYYNKIVDGDGADAGASYGIDLPDGGQAIIVGNIIQKSKYENNTDVIRFAEEEISKWDKHELYVAYNTIITSPDRSNDKIIGTFKSKYDAKIYFLNNIIYEKAKFHPIGTVPLEANVGNVFYSTGQLEANYYPVSTVLESWKSLLVGDIDSYLPQDLKAQSISLIPKYQYGLLNIVPISKPVIPGAVHIP
jgi:hypothetical protein